MDWRVPKARGVSISNKNAIAPIYHYAQIPVTLFNQQKKWMVVQPLIALYHLPIEPPDNDH